MPNSSGYLNKSDHFIIKFDYFFTFTSQHPSVALPHPYILVHYSITK